MGRRSRVSESKLNPVSNSASESVSAPAPQETTDDQRSSSKPPMAERVPVERTVWSDTVVDDYRWLEDRQSQAVLEHLRAENRYTEQIMAPMVELQDRLFHEIKSRVKETDMSVPVIKDDWIYYSRTVEGLDYAISCRRPLSSIAEVAGVGVDAESLALVLGDTDRFDAGHEGEQVLLDENIEAGDGPFFDIGVFEVSPDHRQLLWAYDRTGDERFTIVVRDLERGEDHHEGIDDVGYGSAWAMDNQHFFYVRNDEANRPHQVWRHRVGTRAGDDVLVFDESDERFFVAVGRDKDDSYIQISASSKITDEVWIIPAEEPLAAPRVIRPRNQGIEYSVAHHGDQFVIHTNDGAENFRVVIAPENEPGPDNWRELVPGSDDVTISGLDVCRHHLAVFERSGGSTRIRLRLWDTGRWVTVEQPEEVSTSWPGANPDYDSTLMRYGYSSMVTPPSVFLFDPDTGQRHLIKQQEVLGDFDPERYETRRLWADSDGVAVPVSIVYRRDRPLDRPGPYVLYAYGAYEASSDPVFSAARLSLLDRGCGFAIAHARGGGEMGRRWYLDGKLTNKQNTFTDVIAAARTLINTGLTSPERLVLRGGSAGGLMAGAVMNREPDLFAGIVAQVPFVDTLTTMLNPNLPLTVTEWEEWGNPATDPEAYHVMRAYSPIDNVAEQPYPSVLATAGLNDTRVSYWEAAKWVQKLRRHTTSDAPILLWTDLDSGHGGPSGRYDAWREEARIMAYIAQVVGLST